MKLYHHKTDGGAEYLMDTFIECENGHKEGVSKDAKYTVRIDGDITKDAELNIREEETAIKELANKFEQILKDKDKLTTSDFQSCLEVIEELALRL